MHIFYCRPSSVKHPTKEKTLKKKDQKTLLLKPFHVFKKDENLLTNTEFKNSFINEKLIIKGDENHLNIFVTNKMLLIHILSRFSL